MKKLISFLVVILTSLYSGFAQKRVNLILSIDNQVSVGSLSSMKLNILKNDNTKNAFDISYSPGDLMLPDSCYSKILSLDTKEMLLTFNYIEYCDEEQRSYNYEIDFKKGWVENNFTVVNIYNTNKKRYKNIYLPLPNKSYTYEVIYPGGAQTVVKKKNKVQTCFE